MEPGTSREIPNVAGCPNPTGLREETPGEEAKGGEGSTVMLKRKGADDDTGEEVKAQCEDGEDEKQIKSGEEEDAGKREEELDPRIQAFNKIIINITEVLI